jgi:hypothetical protein
VPEKKLVACEKQITTPNRSMSVMLSSLFKRTPKPPEDFSYSLDNCGIVDRLPAVTTVLLLYKASRPIFGPTTLLIQCVRVLFFGGGG